MKKLLSVILTVALCVGLMPSVAFGAKDSKKPIERKLQKDKKTKYVEGEAVILLKDNTVTAKSSSIKSLSSELDLPSGVKIKDSLEFTDTNQQKSQNSVTESSKQDGPVVLNVSSDKYSTDQLIKELDKVDEIKYAEPNFICEKRANSPNDYFDYQWGLENTGQNKGTSGEDVNIDDIWNATDKGNTKKDTIVAIIDTGVDYTHKDLKDNMWVNHHTNKLAGKHGFDFVNDDTDPMDDDGHGTHVAGIIGGTGKSGDGVSGVNQGVKIMALKLLGGGYSSPKSSYDDYEDGDFYDALSAYEYINKAITLGYKVTAVNNSWGGGEESSKIFKEIIESVGKKGCISVSAAGNDYENNDEWGAENPAGIESPYNIVVAATNENGNLAEFSNYGKETVDIAAPGNNILSSVFYDSYNPTIYDNAKRNNLSKFFKGFDDDIELDDIRWQNWVDGEWEYSSPGALETSTSSLSVENGDYFGKGNDNTKSMKWNIKEVEEGNIFNLYIPYNSNESDVPIQMAGAAKILKGPSEDLDDEDASYAMLLVSDTKISQSGKLPNAFKDEDSLMYEFATAMDTFGPMDQWMHLNGPVNYNSKEDTNRALVFTYIAYNDGTDHEVLLDDLGLSKGGSSSEDLGKYAFYTGTSMATPMVTGAVSLISESKPNYSPLQRALEVAHMSDGSLPDKVTSGGKLDLSKYNQTNPYITGAKVSGNNVVISGIGFGTPKGTVKVNGSNVSSSKTTWKNTSITIPGSSVKNKEVDFEVITSDNKSTKATIYVVQGKPKYSTEGGIYPAYKGSLTTDGKNLYMSNYGGELYVEEEYLMDPDDMDDDDFDFYNIRKNTKGKKIKVKAWEDLEAIDSKKMFPDATTGELKSGVINFETELSYLNGKFYTIAALETGYSSCYALAAYDVKKDRWDRIADRPGAELRGTANKYFASVKMPSLATYNGKIYLMGGLDMNTYKSSNKVQVFDPAKRKWSTAPAMPEGRFLSVGRQTGDKLVLSMGGNGITANDSAAAPLVFNGKSWKKGKAIDAPMKNSEYVISVPKGTEGADEDYDPWFGQTYTYLSIPYYNAAVGIANGGLIYGGLPSNALGDTYTYNVSGNKYTASNYQYQEKAEDEEFMGIAIGRKFLVATADNFIDEYEFDDDDFWSKSKSKLSGSSYDYDMYDDEMEDYSSYYSIPISSGLINLSTNKIKKSKGKVKGIGGYLPGQNATLTATGKKHKYYVKKIKVGGKTVKSDKYTVRVMNKHTRATVYFTKYKTKVKLNKKKAAAKAGKTIKLKAKVKKARKNVKKVKWSVSNKKYASVTRKGKVKLKKKGKGKTVKIIARATDGSGAKAVCKIKIK